jgi:ribonuclease J
VSARRRRGARPRGDARETRLPAPKGETRETRAPAGPKGEARETRVPAEPKGGARVARGPAEARGLQVIPLGGLGEIGKNSIAIRFDREIVIVDAGLMFPDEEMLGIDFVIPDFQAIAREGTVRGIVLTHGHEDHVGGLPYLLKTVPAPVYGTALTLGLARRRVEEAQGGPKMRGITVTPRRPFRLGPFEIEFVHVNHSIPQACAVILRTPGGTVVCTGDFKFDQTPIDGAPTDFSRLAEVGEAGVHLALMDSTNVERPGYAPSERSVGAAIDEVFGRARGRILVTTFASNVHRLQQIFRIAAGRGRKVAVAGRSMLDTTTIATAVGVLKIPRGTLVPLEQATRLHARQVVILTTGSQGEPLSALARMASGTHRAVSIHPGDTVVFSASPIPGNEATVGRTINQLYRQGAEVIHGAEVHATGHACQEELKLMLTLLRPRFFVPVHGEYRHLVLNQQLATTVGIPKERTLVAENGHVIAVADDRIARAGTIEAGNVLVDGLGVGVGAVVLRDRRHLAQDGMLIAVVALDHQSGELLREPDIVSRGFVYMRESGDLIEACKKRVREVLAQCRARGITEWGAIRSAIRETLGRFLFEQTHRQPMILPLLVEL